MLDTCYLGSMQPPGGGRPPSDPRYMSLFCTFNITFPSDENIKTIYKNILDKHFADFADDIKEAVDKITDMTLKLHKEIMD